ncbi:hypothetical protein [Streptomyces sp. EKR5.2]|uniref:hypothetical protein n=1 Tax=Streptomyces sp. EKR5.2 TaxID=3461014 RepID=UPI004041C350
MAEFQSHWAAGLCSGFLVSTVVVEEGWRMGSPFEELEAREAVARLRVEELEAEVAELSGKLELARAGLERLRITRETVTEVLAEMTPEKPAVAIDAARSIEGGPVVSAYAGAERQVIGVLTVPNWQPGMCARDLYRPAPLPVPLAVTSGPLRGQTGTVTACAELLGASPGERLVVTGPRGSGKTTCAMLLVEALLKDPRPGTPVPILLSLSSWDPEAEESRSWVARRITEDYAGAVHSTREHGNARSLSELPCQTACLHTDGAPGQARRSPSRDCASPLGLLLQGATPEHR